MAGPVHLKQPQNLNTLLTTLMTSTIGPHKKMPGTEENCYESEGFFKFQYTVDDLLLAASTAATVFNVLVIFCAVKLFKRNGDTMHLFIINMSLGDLLLTVFCHPNEFLIRKHAFLRHIHLCTIIHFCNWLGLAISGLSLTLLNVDKLIYFRWPLSYEQTMSKRRAIIFCVFIWAISFGFVSYVWYYEIVYVTVVPNCMLQMRHGKKYYYEVFMIMFCVLPVTSSLVVSAYLFRLTRQKRHIPTPVLDGTNIDRKTFRNKLKSLVFIFATTVWTSFSLLPYRIFNIFRIHFFDWESIGCDQRALVNWVAWMLLYLLVLNPIVNPLITAIIYAPYRMTLKRLLISFPIGGNRLQYATSTYTRTETETSYAPSVRRARNHRVNGTNETNGTVSSTSPMDQHEMDKFSKENKAKGVSQGSTGADHDHDQNSSSTTSSSLFRPVSSSKTKESESNADQFGTSDHIHGIDQLVVHATGPVMDSSTDDASESTQSSIKSSGKSTKLAQVIKKISYVDEDDTLSDETTSDRGLQTQKQKSLTSSLHTKGKRQRQRKNITFL